MQKNSEQAKGEQIEHYKKLVAELGEQLESRKKTIQEQLVQADEIAESSHSTEILWMCMFSLSLSLSLSHLFLLHQRNMRNFIERKKNSQSYWNRRD